MEHCERKPVFRFHPTRMPVKRPTTADRLVLHVEVDYVHKQGLGIGIFQQTERMAEEGAKRARAGNISPTKEQKYSMKGDSFRAENVKTKERACMLALLHALGMAYGMVKLNDTKEGSHGVEEVKIMISSPSVAEIVNHHILNAPKSLEDIAKTNDRLMIGRVIKHARKVFRRGVNVSIVVADEQNTTVARARARTLARQRGSKACKSRRQRVRTQNNDPTEDLSDPGMEEM